MECISTGLISRNFTCNEYCKVVRHDGAIFKMVGTWLLGKRLQVCRHIVFYSIRLPLHRLYPFLQHTKSIALTLITSHASSERWYSLDSMRNFPVLW